MSERGRWNSSLTRVRPVFNCLFGLDPTGRQWLIPLWDVAAARRPLGAVIERPADLGSLDAARVLEPRKYRDRVLNKEINLPAAFEKRLPPPVAFLEWLLKYPGAMKSPYGAGHYGASGENERRRQDLFSVQSARRQGAQQEGLAQLAAEGADRSDRQWWAFEGFSEVDCCLETDSAVIFLEGKRKETLSDSTAWYPGRNQLWRNVEVAAQYADHREYGVIVAVEQELDGYAAMIMALQSLDASYPHLTPAHRQELSRHFLGFVTWSELQALFDLGAECLPESIEDLKEARDGGVGQR